jgi:RNA polymerase sigma-70 factor (ECF subfamily)
MSAPFTDDSVIEELPPASPDDKEMALAFQRGEKGAYQVIYDEYEERVRRVCRRMLGKPEDAQEAAQEAFLRVYVALGKFNGRYQLGAWITRIATNVCLDQIRARSRRPVEATPVEDLELEFAAAGFDSDPETVTVRAAESRRVRKVLLGLPPLHRAAIVLRDFEGLSYAEVAVALGMTECQVKALIHRARKGFRRSWTPLVEMLIPAKLLQRFRDVDASVKEQVANAAATHSAPAVSVCTGLLQQCGAFVVERVFPVGMGLVLGGGAAVAAVPAAITDSGEQIVVAPAPSPVDAISASFGKDSGRVAPAPTPTPSDESAPAASQEPAASPPPEPSASPSPSAAPTGGPPASASPPPAGGTAGNPRETPAPAPFLPEIYFQYGQSPTPREPVAHSVRVDCSARSVDQTLSAEVSDHEGSYPIDMHLKTSSSTFETAFTVRKKGFDVNYSGSGALISQSNTGTGYQFTFNGRYGSGGTAAESAGLPVNGSIRVELGLDCQAQTLVAESVVFTTQ